MLNATFFHADYICLRSRKYASVVFIANNRFETGKRKLGYLTFNDFISCAEAMMSNWVSNPSEARGDFTDLDFDREFFLELRDLKVFAELEKEYKT